MYLSSPPQLHRHTCAPAQSPPDVSQCNAVTGVSPQVLNWSALSQAPDSLVAVARRWAVVEVGSEGDREKTSLQSSMAYNISES